MWLFESDVDTEGIKKYKKNIEQSHISDIVKNMAMDYLSGSNEEKALIKYRIENILNACKETEAISILVTLVTFIISNFTKEIFKVIKINVIIMIIAFIIMYYLVCSYKYFKVCKLYMKVIEDAEQEKIKLEIDSNNNKHISFD